MKVSNLQPFELVYAIVEHAHLGWLIEPHVVQINSLGNRTLLHQKVHVSTLDYFQKGIDDLDRKLISILDLLDQEQIVKLFYTKESLRPAAFFKKVFTEELFKKSLRPYIEKKLAEVIPQLINKKVFLAGKDGNIASKRIEVAQERCTVLFHFRREEQSIRYFPTIKFKGERIDFMMKGGIMLCTQPAWMCVGERIYSFEKNVDGNKLLPFLNKRFIEIPKSSEALYFKKFVVPLVEKFDVYAIGFEIQTISEKAVPVLQPDTGWENDLRLNLYFKYGKQSFPYHSNKKVSVILEQEGENYIFKRLRRAKEWELSQAEFLNQLGLSNTLGSQFQVISEFSNTNATLSWLIKNKKLLIEKGFIIDQNVSGFNYSLDMPEISVNVKEYQDWFDVFAVVKFGKFEIKLSYLKKYILAGKREFELPDGKIAVIPEEWFSKYSSLFELGEEEDEKIRINRFHWGILDELDLEPDSKSIGQNLAQAFKSLSNFESEPLPMHFNATLRTYQKEGYDWFYILKSNHFGGCLADDMGLGKTIQALALLQREKEIWQDQIEKETSEITEELIIETDSISRKGEIKQISIFDQSLQGEANLPDIKIKKSNIPRPSSLLVLPTSLVFNWVNEAKKFAPELRILVHSGSSRIKDAKLFKLYDLVITTYGVMRLDIDILKQFKFHYIILDESQNIKNPDSQTARTARSLNSFNKLVLTGTPVENTINDLWSQMEFVNPGMLGSYSYFQKKFVVPIEKNNDEETMNKLQKMISPFILRRTKEQVAKELPEKTEQIIYCEMNENQEKMYEKTKSFYRNQILGSISNFGIEKSKLQILKGLLQLRQIANHPILADTNYSDGSGKFDEVSEKLYTAIQGNHKVLIFSQFVKHLEVFKKKLNQEGIRFSYLDGSMDQKSREKEIYLFNNEQDRPVFLISLKAGGVGLNLTAADYVFVLDPWWNPAAERQAIDRAYRIGQNKNVFVYKFISSKTVEEKILGLQEKKSGLAEGLIKVENSFLSKISQEDLDEILG